MYNFLFIITAFLFFCVLKVYSVPAGTVQAAGNPSDTSEKIINDSIKGQKLPDDSTAAAAVDTVSDSANGTAGDSAKPLKMDTIVYFADSIKYVTKDKTLRLKGNTKILYQGAQLKADSIVYYSEKQEAVATGNPELIDGDQIIYGESMRINVKSKKGKVEYGTTVQDKGLYNGREIFKQEDNTILAQYGDYCSCDDPFADQYYFYSRRMKIVPGKKIVAKPVVLNIEDVPVAVLPFFIFPVKKGRRSGILLPKWGERSDQFGNRGFFLRDMGFYWATNDFMDVSVKSDFDNGEGFFFKDFRGDLTLNYRKKYWISQGYTHGYLGNTQSANGQKRNWRFDFAHNQNLLPDGSWTLYGKGTFVGDKNELRKFSVNQADILNRRLTSNLSSTKLWREKNLSLTMSANQNRNLNDNETSETLPEYNFRFNSRPLITMPEDLSPEGIDSLGLIYNIRYGFDSRGKNSRFFAADTFSDSLLLANPDLVKNDFSYQAIDHNATISAPTKVFEYFTLSPHLNVGNSWFFQKIIPDLNVIDTLKEIDSITAAGDTVFTPSLRYNYTTGIHSMVIDTARDTINQFDQRTDWSTGVRLTTRFYGILQPKIGRFGGFRHTLSPTVGYIFSPKREGYEQFLRAGGNNVGNTDTRSAITFGVGNLFESKILGKEEEGEKISKDKKIKLVNFSTSSSYNFKADSLKLADLSSRASTNIFALDFGWSARHRFYDQNNKLIINNPLLLNYRISMGTGLSLAGTMHNGLNLNMADFYEETHYSPWKLGIRFTSSFSKTRIGLTEDFNENKNFSLSGNAGMQITRWWNLQYNNSYNLIQNKVASQSFVFKADLNCWEAVFNWFPSGFAKGFYFRVNIKEIPDIKYEKRDGSAGGYGRSSGYFQ